MAWLLASTDKLGANYMKFDTIREPNFYRRQLGTCMCTVGVSMAVVRTAVCIDVAEGRGVLARVYFGRFGLLLILGINVRRLRWPPLGILIGARFSLFEWWA